MFTIILFALYGILGVVMAKAGIPFNGYYFAIVGLVIAIDVMSHLRAKA